MNANVKTQAWIENLYRQEYPQMVEYASRRLNNEDMAQELVQETFRLLLEDVDKLVFHTNIQGWLRQTLKNRLLAYWKTGRAELRRFVTYEEAQAQHKGHPSPEERFTQLTNEEILQIARRRLTDEHYRHLVRLTVDGASHATVAKEFGITVSASEKRLERSRRVLKGDFPGWRRKINFFQKICQLSMLAALYI